MSTMHEGGASERHEFDRLLDEVNRMDDDALDAMVVRAAAEYNAPPARPPVDAMWAHIAAARRPARRGGIHVQRWQLIAASVAFLAFGITIGRRWTDVAAHAGAPARAHTAPRVATTRTGSPSVEPSAESVQVAVAPPSDATGEAGETGETHASLPRRRSRAEPHGESSAPSAPSTNASGADAAYRLATMRHFVAAEALLASYDGSAHDAKTDAQLASWASDLLSQTRLLIDSPAGRDPVRRRLLQDLELVLVQMAQLGPGTPQLEHDLIDGSVRHNDIITRLRSAVPAGATTAL